MLEKLKGWCDVIRPGVGSDHLRLTFGERTELVDLIEQSMLNDEEIGQLDSLATYFERNDRLVIHKESNFHRLFRRIADRYRPEPCEWSEPVPGVHVAQLRGKSLIVAQYGDGWMSQTIGDTRHWWQEKELSDAKTKVEAHVRSAAPQ